MHFSYRKPFIVVGQGIAGSVIAWKLDQMGLDVTLIDEGGIESCSQIAAGVLNPITGKRLVKKKQVELSLPLAITFYKSVQQALKASFFYDWEIIRLIQTDLDLQLFERRFAQSDYKNYITAYYKPKTFGETLIDTLGSFGITNGGVLNVREFIYSIRNYFKRKKRFIQKKVPYEALDIKNNFICFCEGWRAIYNPWFKNLPFSLSKGEILTIEIEGNLPTDKIINYGKWIVPQFTAHNRFKAGATFELSKLEEGKTKEGQFEIVESIKNIVTNKFKVIAHHSAIRPSTKNQQPLVFWHSELPNLAIFNGFGTNGSMLAPFYADQLISQLNAASSAL